MNESAVANEDQFRRWLRRIVLVASVLAIGCHACWTVLVYRNFGFVYLSEVLSLTNALQPMPWMLLLGIFSFANQRFAIRWKLLAKAALLMIAVSLTGVAISSLIGWMSWVGSPVWLSFFGRVTIDLTSFCFLAVALHVLRLAIPHRLDWAKDQSQTSKDLLSILDLFVVTGLVAGLFVCGNLYRLFLSNIWESQGFDEMAVFVGHAIFSSSFGMIIVASFIAALGIRRRLGWVLGFLICAVVGFASPLLIAALYGNLAGSQPYRAAATAAVTSNTVFFLTFTCFLMTGRKLGVRFAKAAIIAAPL